MNHKSSKTTLMTAALAVVLAAMTISANVSAQDRDDPPGRAARLGLVEGSVSFEPGGESEWVDAVPNRPMTIDDKLWADRDSRAEVDVGSASIYLNSNTGISFLNLDDRTVQIQLSAGSIDIRVRDLHRDDVFEIDTPNQAFSVYQPGRYRLEASENGDSTVVSVREGEGESTGNGQSYTVHAGQRATFSGTTQLNVAVDELGGPDGFDNWSYGRERRYEESRSARYCPRDMVGYQDLDEYGDWRGESEYGNVWFPRVEAGWAPYRFGHWAWIDPWGWTWVDDDPWGYAPFHYGRWAFFGGAWGWVPGPVDVVPVYAPALVVFVGGGGFVAGGDVAWFPLGPREVFVPSYPVSATYVNRVNITNTTINQTTITNVYNTTIVNKNTTITNVNYVNRNVNGAVTAVPQRAFATAQPVNRVAVPVSAQQLARVQVSARAPVAPAREAVLGAHANTAGRVAAPPPAVVNRPVLAKTQPPPPPPPFAARQQALAQHPGQPLPRGELQRMRPGNTPAAHPQVKVVAPSRPAPLPPARPGNQPANAAPPNQPGNRPGNPPAANERPGMNPAQPNRPQPNQPSPNQPSPNQPSNQPSTSRPAQPNRPFEPPPRNDRPPATQPNNAPNRPQPNQPPPNNRPETNRPPESNRPPSAQPNNPPNRPQPNEQPSNNRPEANRPESSRPEPSTRQEPGYPSQNRQEAPRNEPPPPRQNPSPSERPQPERTPPEARPAQQPDRPPARQPSPEEQKRQEEQRKQEEQRRDQKPQPPG